MPNLPAKIALFNEINSPLKENKMPNFLNKISLLNVMDFFAKSIVYFIYQHILTNKLLYKRSTQYKERHSLKCNSKMYGKLTNSYILNSKPIVKSLGTP